MNDAAKTLAAILLKSKEDSLRDDPPLMVHDMSAPDRRTMDRRVDDIERRADAEQLAAAIAEGFKVAVKETLADRELMADYWKQGYVAFTAQASSGASQWVGKRILTAAAFALLGLLVAWLVKTGALK